MCRATTNTSTTNKDIISYYPPTVNIFFSAVVRIPNKSVPTDTKYTTSFVRVTDYLRAVISNIPGLDNTTTHIQGIVLPQIPADGLNAGILPQESSERGSSGAQTLKDVRRWSQKPRQWSQEASVDSSGGLTAPLSGRSVGRSQTLWQRLPE